MFLARNGGFRPEMGVFLARNGGFRSDRAVILARKHEKTVILATFHGF